MDTSVFEYFIFGENIAEEWIFYFSWMAPPGIVSMNSGSKCRKKKIWTSLCFRL